MLRKEMARKDAQILEWEQKAKTISKEEEASLRRRVHDFERNERKMIYEIAALNERLTAVLAEGQARDAQSRDLERQLGESRLEKERLENRLKELLAQAAVKESRPVPAQSSPPRKANGRRLGVFVDMRSLGQASRRLQQKIDFKKLLDFIVLDRYLVKAVAYVMANPEMDNSRFGNMLEQRGFQVRSRNLVRLPDGSYQGNWGAGMATDIIQQAEKMNLDIVHLVSGDADFVDLIKFLKAKGVRAEASGFEINSAAEFIQAADEFVVLDTQVLRDPLLKS